MKIKKLAERLEQEIHMNMIKLRELDSNYQKLEEVFETQDKLDDVLKDMARIANELYPVLNIIVLQNPDSKEMFEYLIDVYDKQVAPKKRGPKALRFEDAMEIGSFDTNVH